MQHYESLNRLKGLFRELFQLDTADLDFGLYRLFRLKRTEIEAFLDKQLPAEVDRAFEAVTGDEREKLQKQVAQLAKQARESVADDAIFPSGETNPKYAETKAVKEYAEARKRMEAVEATEAQRAEVFNQLYAFFSRYYDEGDFIPRRFFGARPAYAVPHNGEEVLFHWANRDQYYVKSGEAFRDYAFMLNTLNGEYRVRFKLVEATISKDNTKGDTRFFFPRHHETVFDKTTRILTVPFEYRLPTESEAARYGAKGKAQETIRDAFEQKILDAVTDTILKAVLAEPSPTGREKEGETPPTLLRRRLAHFTKKNTADFFVHKNLGAFLRQELEFFIRDQIVHEADLEGDFESKRRMLRVFRKLADTVITFLAQIEEAQKRLFEKKKFVFQTDYLVPIQNVPHELWKDVLANKAQLEEWKALFSFEPKSDLFNLKGKINEYVLEQHPTLVVDTRHFPPNFTARLLESIEDLDEWTDGVLMHGENFQALSFMQMLYRGKVKCVYIDPPFNTEANAILYKNNYRHSSWLSLMHPRLCLSQSLEIPEDGVHIVAIDEAEQSRLRLLLYELFREREITCVTVIHNPAGTMGKNFSATNEYAFFLYDDTRKTITKEDRTDDPDVRDLMNTAKGSAGNYLRNTGKTCFYPLFVRDMQIVGFGDVCPDDFHPTQNVKRRDGITEVYPIDAEGVERKWVLARDTVEKNIADLYPKVDPRSKKIRIERRKSAINYKTVWTDGKYSAKKYGTELLGEIIPETREMPRLYPKSVHLVMDCLHAGTNNTSNPIIIDYFAGSGTTGHAGINLNREDGGRRKFILVEMADYFDTVLVPRIKKVMFAPEWREGKPKRLATNEEAERMPRLVKVLGLESYEDALHNTFSDSNIERLSEREKAYQKVVGDEEYRIRYLVKLPLKASDSMLSLARLEHPFDYTIETLSDYGSKAQTVDLVETFNWLYGLRVRRFFTWVNKGDKTNKDKEGRRYRAVLGTDQEGKKRVLVVWRDMTNLEPVKDREFLEAKSKEIGPFEEQWVNGDSAAKGFASLDPLFKRLMAGDET